MSNELYFSIDVETNGPIPGDYSMLSFGVAAFEPLNFVPVAKFSANLEVLDGRTATLGDPATMAWWSTNQAAYEATRTNVRPCGSVMRQFVPWVYEIANQNKRVPVCIAYPAGFDFMFLYWYMLHFAGKSPFSFSCLDLKTLGFTLNPFLGYKGVSKRSLKKYLTDSPHTHVAIDDAVEQGLMFLNMLNEVTQF